MMIGQVYFEWASPPICTAKGGVMFSADAKVRIIRDFVDDGINKASFLLVELPGKLLKPLPCVVVDWRENRHWYSPMLLTFKEPPVGTLVDPGPRYAELLLEVTAELYAGILKEPDPARATRCYMEYADIHNTLAPSDFRRQKFAIAARWSAWEQLNLTWHERAASLFTDGIYFHPSDGEKNVDSLKKFCARNCKLKIGTF